VPPARSELNDAQGLDCTLEIGGNEAESDALFNRAIAELAIFERALTATECSGIARYLKERYRI
jgi:hypothetical protein